MKLRTWTAGIAALVLSAAPVFAVEGNVQWSNSLVTPASCDEDCCDPGCECGDPCDCGAGVGAVGLFSGIGPGYVENFSLASMLGLSECSAFEVGGWTQLGYSDRQEPLSVTPNDGLAFNDRPRELNVQQQWFYAGKTADGSNGLDWGFRGDFIYGTDAKKTQAFGNPGNEWDKGWDFGDKGAYGWAIPQAYGEIAVGDFTAKVGHFFTPLGYEVIPATGNFFYSHSLTMFNSEPFTHTGVLTTYTGFEGLTLYNGWSAGWDTGFDSSNAGSNYIGGFSSEVNDSVTFTYLMTYGNFGLRGAGNNPANPNSTDNYSHSIVLNASLTDKLTYIFQTDYLNIENDAIALNDYSGGVNQYLLYQWNDVIGFGTRLEWWKGAGLVAPYNTYSSKYEVTGGVNVKLLGNLIIRPEVRKDWYPAEGIDRDMCACDAILTY